MAEINETTIIDENNNVTVIDNETGEIMDNYDLDTADEATEDGGNSTNKLAVAGVIAGVIAGGVAVYKNRKKIAKAIRDKRRARYEKKLAKYDELDAAYALETKKEEDDFDDDFFEEDPKTEGNNTEAETTQQVEKENPTPKKGK